MSSVTTRTMRTFWVVVGAIGLSLAAALAVHRLVSVTPLEEESAESDAANDEPPKLVSFDRDETLTTAGIETERVQSKPMTNTISVTGYAAFNGNAYVKVPSKAPGILRKINVDVGALVKAGDTLAIINSQAAGDLKASLIRASIHEEHSRTVIKRYQDAGEGVPQKMLIEEQHLLEEELTETRRIRDRLQEFGFSIEQIDRVVQNKDSSIELPLFAPRAGTLVERKAVEGEPVETTMSLFAIADLDSMWIHLHVYESQLSQVHLGQIATFYPDGLPGEGFSGAINWISPEVDAQTRTIQVRAEVANRRGMLRANMYGRGELVVEEPRERVIVNQAAVQTFNGSHVVFVEKPGRQFEVRQVQIGAKHDPYWEVTSGLSGGEQVATTGSFLLKSNLENADFGKVE